MQYIQQSSTLIVEPHDAVIILKSDGSCEASLPQSDKDEVPENIVMGAALMYALQNQSLCDLIHQNFMQECAKLNMPNL